jgi:hypothetical protein
VIIFEDSDIVGSSINLLTLELGAGIGALITRHDTGTRSRILLPGFLE